MTTNTEYHDGCWRCSATSDETLLIVRVPDGCLRPLAPVLCPACDAKEQERKAATREALRVLAGVEE